MSDQLPSRDAINHLLFDDASVIHPELRDLMHLYVSGRLVDREAINYKAAAALIEEWMISLIVPTDDPRCSLESPQELAPLLAPLVVAAAIGDDSDE